MDKPELETTIEYYRVIDYARLEQFVEKIYGFKEYSFVATQECGNDTNIIFNIDGNLDKWDLEDWSKMESSKEVLPFRNRLVLNKLCKDEYIKPGQYLIKISW